jgi:hypothetical protein
MADARRRDPQKDGWSDGPILPRWALWLMLPGIVGPLLVFVFIVVTQRAHDPARCPYHEVGRRELAAGVSVLEEARTCIAGVEEHRFSLRRGTKVQVLGERRFDQRAFAPGSYTWQASLSAQGEVHVDVHNAGHDDVKFREGTAAEHARDALPR